MINPPQIDWMIFKPEGTDVLYIWDGQFPILLHVPVHEGNYIDWYWAGKVPEALSDSEVKLLHDVAKTKRKQVFQVPRTKRRYQVVTRGTYEYTNK